MVVDVDQTTINRRRVRVHFDDEDEEERQEGSGLHEDGTAQRRMHASYGLPRYDVHGACVYIGTFTRICMHQQQTCLHMTLCIQAHCLALYTHTCTQTRPLCCEGTTTSAPGTPRSSFI